MTTWNQVCRFACLAFGLLFLSACDPSASLRATDEFVELKVAGGMLRVANDCNVPVDSERLARSARQAADDIREVAGYVPALGGVRVVLRPLDGLTGRYTRDIDAIELACGFETTLRHELGHRNCYEARLPCNCRQVTTEHHPSKSEFNEAHPLRLDCSPWDGVQLEVFGGS